MPLFLVDVNLPRWFSQWNSADYVHQHDLDPAKQDTLIWEYAAEPYHYYQGQRFF